MNRNTRPRAAAPPGDRPWYRIRNAADDEDVVEILIYDEIGYSYWYGGVSAQDMVRELQKIDADEIRVRINSPGGDVFEGIAILNALRSHPARVTTVIDGLAASAASFIAMAGDEIVIARNAEMMIHEASGLCIGNAADMRELADQLDRVGDNIAGIYADRAGGDATDWREAMRTETWYSDEEAVAAGLADRVERFGNDDASAKTKNRFDLSVFNYAGRRAAPAPPRIAAHQPMNSSATEVEAEKEATVPTLNEELAKRLGVSEDADDDTLLGALDEALAEGEETTAENPAVPATAESVTQAAARFGLTVVDSATLEQLRADARLGRQASERQEREDRERIVDNAIGKGKIPPSRRDHWLNLLTVDKAMADTLNALPDELAVPLTEIGHSVDGSTSNDADLSWFGNNDKKGA
ncbi:hypothetical protein IM25_22745 [Rhodococcus sp. p52]|uniref:ATP-dependent Clp protease proteolytic subunit n=1 Tax=Rhodococcus rhodochrous J45 TaxID=935266 RepID=A0A562D8M2_RHORH|nr:MULTISPECIES: head maturation protease, ClpP-related [Rhodococcus]AOD24052.1 hypothetical protein IM25_22745 [Rhodococcus sp. p52]TWH05541.1 ATP-dependent protease ClpP protease subunit [Rhodococcus rhodochrous J45]